MIHLRAPYTPPITTGAALVRVGADDKYAEPQFPYVLLIPAAIGGGIGWYLAKVAGLGSFLTIGAVTSGAMTGFVAFLVYDHLRERT